MDDFSRWDWDRFEALESAGFKVDAFGDPHWHLIERLSGHYMDVGASAKISNGIVSHTGRSTAYSPLLTRTFFWTQIKVKSGAALTHYAPSGLGFSDGTELPADLVVFATGFDPNIQGRIREISGDCAGSAG